MSQSSSEKYVYFTVGILKDSAALEALKQDALKHHMIDQPGQLIALRITEYYEMMNKGVIQPVVRVPAIMMPIAEPEETKQTTSPQPIPLPTASPSSGGRSILPVSHSPQGSLSSYAPTPNQSTGKMRSLRREESFVSASANAEQNADDAADYWSTL
jgi:hypothetical protein